MDKPAKLQPGYGLEIAATVLISLATIVSAWTTYQSVRWSGVQANSYATAISLRTESVRYANQANFLNSIDVSMFMNYFAARSQGNASLTQFLEQRFRPEFQPAMAAWLATRPFTNPDAPTSPFEMPQYRINDRQTSLRLNAAAEQLQQRAQAANQTADNYTLMTVLFASVSFLAGVGSQFRKHISRLIFLIAAALVLAGAIAVILTFPVE